MSEQTIRSVHGIVGVFLGAITMAVYVHVLVLPDSATTTPHPGGVAGGVWVESPHHYNTRLVQEDGCLVRLFSTHNGTFAASYLPEIIQGEDCAPRDTIPSFDR